MPQDCLVHGLPRVGGDVAGSGALRLTSADFRVAEDLPIELAGTGEHLWLHVEKSGWTTPALAGQLARHYGVQHRAVGYAGLKDRHAVARQWFSVPVGAATTASAPPDLDGIIWLATVRHERKLRRGAHRGNHFVLCVQRFDGDREAADAALLRVDRDGVPNYFGAQRFGYDGGNLALARSLFAGRGPRGFKRGIALSAARAYVFNALAARRVADGTWNRLIEGEVVALDGSRSVFELPAGGSRDNELLGRLQRCDIHPSGPLPGAGRQRVTAAAATLEDTVLGEHAEFVDGLIAARVDADRRALRLPVRALDWHWPDGDLEVSFTLPAGAFATVVLREVVDAVEAMDRS